VSLQKRTFAKAPTIVSVDRHDNAALVEFSNGQIGSYSPKFLLENINAEGNLDLAKKPAK
jgi:hypothetical protein